MKKINLYKPGPRGKDAVPKTIQEVAEELDERLKSQGLKPDSYFLSANFKGAQKDDFPVDRKVSGTLSVGKGEVRAFISLDSEDGEESQLKGRMCIAQYKIDKGKMAEAFEKATDALKVMMGSFWVNSEEKEKENIKDISDDDLRKLLNGKPDEIAEYIKKALSNSDILDAFNKLQDQATAARSQLANDVFYPFIRYMDKKIIDNYMFMDMKYYDGVPVYMYKNAMNRQYVCIDLNGNFYDENEKISKETAMKIVDEPISSSVALRIPIDEINIEASREADKKSSTEAAKMETGKTQTIKIQTGIKPLVDEKIVDYYTSSNKKTGNQNAENTNTVNTSETVNSSNITNTTNTENIDTTNTAATENTDLKNQLINVNFTPAQAEVVINLLEENQKKYEPKSSMFRLLGDTLGKMLRALNKKLDQIIDSEKVISDKLETIYSAINDENYELFKEKYAGLEQKIKYCHDILSEAAQGRSIQSTNIIDHILNKEKVPVSIRTLQNAFVTAIDNNIESALAIYKYSDENLHGEAHFNTIRGFLSHALNTLPDNEAEKFINISSIRAFDDTVIFKEMIRAEKYNLLNSSLQQCKNINEHAPSLYYFAAQRKDVDALHTLSSIGANVNENNGEALYTCFEENKHETAKILLNFGADIKTLTNRIEIMQKSNPKYTLPNESINFLNDIYRHVGFDEYQPTDQYEDDEVHGENGDLGNIER